MLISHLPHIDFEDMVHKTAPLLLHSPGCDRLSLYQLSFVDTGGKYYPKGGKEEKHIHMYEGHLKCWSLNFPNISADSKAQTSNQVKFSNEILSKRTVSSVIMINHIVIWRDARNFTETVPSLSCIGSLKLHELHVAVLMFSSI